MKVARVDILSRTSPPPSTSLLVPELLELQRRTIAADLHDEFGSIFPQLAWALQDLGSADLSAAARERLAKVQSIVEEAASLSRRVVAQLAPPDLPRTGLVEAVRRHAQAVLLPRGIACTVSVDGLVDELSDETALTAYRAAQEALTNVARHAAATTASVIISSDGGWLRLVVTNDGVTPGGGPSRGAGLRLMQERVAAAGGWVQMGPHAGGWRVVITLPASRG